MLNVSEIYNREKWYPRLLVKKFKYLILSAEIMYDMVSVA